MPGGIATLPAISCKQSVMSRIVQLKEKVRLDTRVTFQGSASLDVLFDLGVPFSNGPIKTQREDRRKLKVVKATADAGSERCLCLLALLLTNPQ